MDKARASGGPGSADPTPVKFTLSKRHTLAAKDCTDASQIGRPRDGPPMARRPAALIPHRGAFPTAAKGHPQNIAAQGFPCAAGC